MLPEERLEQMLELATQEVARRGFAALRPLQAEVLGHLARKQSVFAGLPTGYGKSLCYWIPAAAWGWRVWVISPLISLIEDQAMAAAALGLRVVAWHGKMNRVKRRELEREMANGGWQVCFLSPERMMSWEKNGFWSILRGLGLDADLLVLDEMHCLEEWREFRGGYRDLFEPVRRATSRGSLLLGLSASLSERNSQLWMTELCGPHSLVTTGLGRENLRLHVVALEEEKERWLHLLAGLRGIVAPASALVYCATRNETDEVARWLRSAGLEAIAYHAGLPSEERAARSIAFRRGRLRIICATSAFGMGIDYPHVSRVIHFSLPYDLESYWQEVGRAGRAGQEAYGIAFWRRSEIARARILRGEAWQRFSALWKAWAGGNCRKRAVAERLGFGSEDCGQCDRCAPSTSPIGPRLEEAWWTEEAATLANWVAERLQAESGSC